MKKIICIAALIAFTPFIACKKTTDSKSGGKVDVTKITEGNALQEADKILNELDNL